MLAYGMLGFVVIMGASFLRGTRDKYPDFCVAIWLPLFLVLLLPIGALTGYLRPDTMDFSFRQIDLALGLDGMAMSRWLVKNGWSVVISEFYASLPLVMAFSWALERNSVLVRAVVIGALMAFPLYLLFPACGPQYAFPSFPDDAVRAPAIDWIHPRNCFPSMHFTWAFLLALNAQNRYWRVIFGIYAGLMFFVVVVGGEHYFLDVIAAVPFTFAVQRIAVSLPRLRSLRTRERNLTQQNKNSRERIPDSQ